MSRYSCRTVAIAHALEALVCWGGAGGGEYEGGTATMMRERRFGSGPDLAAIRAARIGGAGLKRPCLRATPPPSRTNRGDVLATSGRIERIDALRGVAALCVCVQHIVHPIIVNLATPATAGALLSAVSVARFDLGRYGVILFFLISGYVIPFSLRDEHALPRFVVTRALRLYPAFWLSVVAVVATDTAVPTAAQVAANLTMAPTLLGQAPLSGVYWTLFVELAFYSLCAMLFAAGLLRRSGVVFALGLACAVAPLAGIVLRRSGVQVPIAYLAAHLSFLFTGTLLRVANDQRGWGVAARALALTLVALAAMPVLAAQPDGSFTRSTPVGVTLAGAAAVATFLALHRRGGAASPALLRLGTLSYSIYLFHIPVMRVVERIIPPAGALAAAMFFTVTLFATLGLATAVYTWVERPMINRGRRMWQRQYAEIAVAP